MAVGCNTALIARSARSRLPRVELTTWERATITTRRALARGALRPIATEAHPIDDGAHFNVVLALDLAAKTRGARDGGDPFAPYDPALFVADVGLSHVLLLNKFPVVTDHLLLVTRAFEDQMEPLTEADFEALYACIDPKDALAFYNAGEIAGASQRHKHLQIVPSSVVTLDASQVALPFAHAMGERPSHPRAAYARYLELCAQAGIDERTPYNLLVTDRTMLVVPRTRERFESISINALGFAGSILVKTHQELARVREIGPMAILRAVSR